MVLSFFFSELRIDVFEQTPSYGFFRLVGKQTRVVNALTTLLQGNSQSSRPYTTILAKSPWDTAHSNKVMPSP